MGFKEVMNLRHAGQLDEALVMAKADIEQDLNQWSASALFWVLRDLVYKSVETGDISKSAKHLEEMRKVVPSMGATSVMAQETLAALEKEVIPHYIELNEIAEYLRTEKNKYKIWSKLSEAYHTFKEWDKEPQGIDERLHEQIASILTNYLDQKGSLLPVEEFQIAISLYLKLKNERPSRLHDKVLKIVLKAKRDYMRKLSLHDFFEQWGIHNLTTEYGWTRPMNKHYYKSMGELTLYSIVEEDLDMSRPTPSPEVEFLFEKAQELFPDDPDLKLARARIKFMQDRRPEAIELYEELLTGLPAYEGRPWWEYGQLRTDAPNIRLSSFAHALKEETNDYADYILDLRLPFAEALIEAGRHEQALRELQIYRQISFEKGREEETKYQELIAQIPDGTQAEEDYKLSYYNLSREVTEYIFRDTPSSPMVVVDVVAYRLKYPNATIVPMLKLMGHEDTVSLVYAKESGILPGDNRGKVYEVKTQPRIGKPSRVVLVTPSDKDPREFFPVEYGFITGYNPELYAFHVINPSSKHRYLPGKESDYEIGTYVSYIHFYEKGMREYLVAPRTETEEIGQAAFPVVRAVVAQVYDGKVYIVTDDGHQGSFDISRAPFDLAPGDTTALRGFIFKSKDKFTGDQQEVFVTLALEPLPPDILRMS